PPRRSADSESADLKAATMPLAHSDRRVVEAQKVNRNDACIRRGSLVAVTCPNRALIFLPKVGDVALPSNRIVLSTVINCVWLKALYISHRSWNMYFSFLSGIFLKNEMSQLLVPGRRNTSFGALPKSPLAGRAKTDVSNQRSKLRSPRERTGLPVITTRAPSPPPVIFVTSAISLVVRTMLCGSPLANIVMPEICQLSKTALMIGLTTDLDTKRLACGRSHR